MREVTETSNGLRITIDNPAEKQTLIVEEMERNISIKGRIHTTDKLYTLWVNDEHLDDLIAALQEIQKRRSRTA